VVEVDEKGEGGLVQVEFGYNLGPTIAVQMNQRNCQSTGELYKLSEAPFGWICSKSSFKKVKGKREAVSLKVEERGALMS